MEDKIHRINTFNKQADIFEPEVWETQLKRIHKSGNPKIGSIHGFVEVLAEKPDRTTYDKIMGHMSFLKDKPRKLEEAIQQIDKVYRKIFHIENAEIIPFTGTCSQEVM